MTDLRMEGAILDTVSFLENIDFGMIFQMMGYGLILFWFVIIGWAAVDATERFTSTWARIGAITLVIVVPLFGFLIYLVIRPRTSTEEEYWMDLERRFLKFEAAGLEDCPACGYELMPNFVHCPNCSRELRVKCESCEVFIEPLWNMCPFCGTAQERKDVTPIPQIAISSIDATVPSPRKLPKRLKPRVIKPRTSTASTFRKIALKADGFVQMVGGIPLKLIPNRNGSSKSSTQVTQSTADIPDEETGEKEKKSDSPRKVSRTSKSSSSSVSKAKRRTKK